MKLDINLWLQDEISENAEKLARHELKTQHGKDHKNFHFNLQEISFGTFRFIVKPPYPADLYEKQFEIDISIKDALNDYLMSEDL